MSNDIFDSDFNLWLSEYGDDERLREDTALRAKGFPQQFLDLLRGAGLSTARIDSLPTPRADTGGKLLDEYWVELKASGVPDSALPPRHRSNMGLPRAEADVLSYSSLLSSYQPGSSQGVGGSGGTAGAPATTSLDPRTLYFGSPRHPVRGGSSSFFTPNKSQAPPPTQSSPSGGASGATPPPPVGSSPGGAPFMVTPPGSQPVPVAPGGDYLSFVDYAIPLGVWPRVRNNL